MEGFEVLDVGCGYYPKGDVNVDLHPEASAHRTGKTENAGDTLNTKITSNFVEADAAHLPFRDGAFKKVLSYHVIEHVPDHELMLRELLRVSSGWVVIRCPHWLGEKHSDFHLHHFRRRWFIQAAKALGVSCNTGVTERIGFPTEMFGLLLVPAEIEATFWKPEKDSAKKVR